MPREKSRGIVHVGAHLPVKPHARQISQILAVLPLPSGDAEDYTRCQNSAKKYDRMPGSLLRFSLLVEFQTKSNRLEKP